MPSTLGQAEKIEMSYMAPDFDPKKIPKKHKQNVQKWKKSKDERADFELSNHMQIRTMAPFNIRCATCGHYTNKGTKIQANVDKFPGMTYLDKIVIWRFHVRCPICRGVICFRTDPENQDYDIVSGGTRSFRSAYVRAREEAEDDRLENEMLENDPMKVLEDRTFASKKELEDVEMVEDLMDKRRNPTQTDSRNVVDRREVSEVTLAKRLITDRLKRDEDEIAEMLGKQVEVLTDKKLDDDEDDHEILKPSFKFRIGGCKESMLSKKLNGVKKSEKESKKTSFGIRKKGAVVIKKNDGHKLKNEKVDIITDKFSDKFSDDTEEITPLSTFLVPRLPNVSKRPATTPISTKTAATAPKQAKPALSLLGAYSDSESDSD